MTTAGKFLGEAHSIVAYLADDGRLIIHDVDKGEFVADPDDLESWFPHDPGVLAEVMHAIGETPEIDI